jgi:aerotaxis receptor
MRTNLPVTTTEYPITDETLIVSRTDLKGKLTYFNEQFVSAAGFAEAELMGQPHNIIRHPDMPPEAFDNLWTTLKAGKPWAGAVKNRRKNGDFYWVLATASPIVENGRVTGYTSIRTKLPAEQRAEAEQVYAALCDKKAHNYKISAGVIRRRSMFDRFAFLTGTLKARLTTLVSIMAISLVAVASIGMLSTRDSNARMKSIYEDRTVPLSQLFEISDRMVNNTVVQYDAVTNGRAGKPVGDVAGKVAANIDAISKIWTAYISAYLTPEEKIAADSFASERKKYLDDAVKPALGMLVERKYDEAGALLAGKAGEIFASAKQNLDKLVAIQVKEAKAEYDAAAKQYVYAIVIVTTGLMVALVFGGLFGRQAIQVVVRPLNTLNQAMLNLTQGKLDNRMPVERGDEIGEAVRNMQNVQAIVRSNSNEVVALQRRSAEQRKADMSKLAADFEGAVSEIIETVSSAATELEASAGTLSSTAERSQQLASLVAAASEEASTNVQSVASASEELISSVNEIAGRCRNRPVSPTAPSKRRASAMIASTNCRRRPPGSVTLSSSSTTLPARPTCWRSTPPSRRRAPVRPVAVSPWWPRR